MDLEIEARDPRVMSDCVLQLLAYRHALSLNAPSNLRHLYFTFQFYDQAPTISELARMKPSGDDEARVFFLQRQVQTDRYGPVAVPPPFRRTVGRCLTRVSRRLPAPTAIRGC